MKIITTEVFYQIIDNIKQHQKEIEKLDKGLSLVMNEPVYSGFGGKLLDNYIDLISLVFNDQTDMLAWFIFENEFGKKDQKALVQGKEISINSAQELFNYLCNKN